MTKEKEYTGFAIALAWPETWCKQPGSWYDSLTRFMGFNKYNYYRAGHAALILVDTEEKSCHYFDFGRYHAPWGHGRVRSGDTDDDLIIQTPAKISADGEKIKNFTEILDELQNNDSCHGDGNLYASYCKINFRKALEKAMSMQKESPLFYGPFIKNGSNCSRFVNTVILAGEPDPVFRFRLRYFKPFTPTPMNNVRALSNEKIRPKFKKLETFRPNRRLGITELTSTLPAPEKHHTIPENALWLSGEGAGSWFVIERMQNFLKLTRYSPDGKIECFGTFEGMKIPDFRKTANINIIHPSNCKELHILYNGISLRFSRQKNTEMKLNKAG